MPEFRIEVAHDIVGCAATVALQEETWSGDVVVHPQLMLAVVHNGGFVALGYATEDPKPAGFVFGFLGIVDYHFRHQSHMLAVRDPYRGSGLAQQLKEAQRDHCLDQGIEIVQDRDGKEEKLGTLGPGDVFGEMALLDEFPRSATVRAVEPTTALGIQRWHFRGILESHPQIALALLPMLTRRIRNAEGRSPEAARH